MLTRIHAYLDTATPARINDPQAGQEITDLAQLPAGAAGARGSFSLVSYAWGVA